MSGICRLETLPPEVEEAWVAFVPPKDLCNLMLTSTFMRTLASNPKLWSAIKVNREKIKEEGLVQLFSLNRFSKSREIDLSEMTFTKEELQRNLNAIVSSSVEVLNMEGVDLSEIPAELVARVAGRLRKMNLNFAEVTNEQCIAVLETCESSSSLVDVSLECIDFKEIPTELIGRAVANLQKIELGMTDIVSISITTEQLVAIMNSCINSSSLVDVSLVFINENCFIPSELLGRAVSHLTKLHITDLTTEQYICVLNSCISSPTLIHVNFEKYMDLTDVPADLLGRASGHLQSIKLGETTLTTQQCLALLNSCISSSTLQEISLEKAQFNEVPAELLGRAAGNLTKININGIQSNSTTEQCMAVFNSCISSTTLVDISINRVNLQAVPAELLERAAGHLRKISLLETSLSNQQLAALLDTCISSSMLLKMSLSGDSLEKAELPMLLTQARNSRHLREIWSE